MQDETPPDGRFGELRRPRHSPPTVADREVDNDFWTAVNHAGRHLDR